MTALSWIAVGLVGGLAAGARYLLDAELSRLTQVTFPVGILAVNLLGATLLGIVAGSGLDGDALVIVAGGVIGSFTTFSTWMLDTKVLATAQLPKLAWLNVTLSLALGLIAVTAGHAIAA